MESQATSLGFGVTLTLTHDQYQRLVAALADGSRATLDVGISSVTAIEGCRDVQDCLLVDNMELLAYGTITR